MEHRAEGMAIKAQGSMLKAENKGIGHRASDKSKE
jgi:hypothetical protein